AAQSTPHRQQLALGHTAGRRVPPRQRAHSALLNAHPAATRQSQTGHHAGTTNTNTVTDSTRANTSIPRRNDRRQRSNSQTTRAPAATERSGLAAERIAGAIRPGDTVARFGGDEFVVVCDDVNLLETEQIAERIL